MVARKIQNLDEFDRPEISIMVNQFQGDSYHRFNVMNGNRKGISHTNIGRGTWVEQYHNIGCILFCI
jgi:hypothetical protein